MSDTVVVSAIIGPTGCYRLYRRDIRETDTTVTLSYYGIHDEPPGIACTQSIALLADTLILEVSQRGKAVRW